MPFGFLQKVDSQNLLTFIIDEHPQTIALIISHLPASQAADIISGLPSDRQLAVVRRIATMGQTSPEIIHEVEKGLEHRMSSVMSQQFENAGGVESVAGDPQRHRPRHRAQPAGKPGPGRSRPGRRDSPA